jgi:hypothetical protein
MKVKYYLTIMHHGAPLIYEIVNLKVTYLKKKLDKVGKGLFKALKVKESVVVTAKEEFNMNQSFRNSRFYLLMCGNNFSHELPLLNVLGM